MRRTTETVRRTCGRRPSSWRLGRRRIAAIACVFFGSWCSLLAQEAFVKAASLEADQDAPGEYRYRLEIAYAKGHPGIEPKASIAEAAGIRIMSLSVKPYRRTGSEIVIDFTAPAGSAWTFPEISLTWMAERLVVPPRPGPASGAGKQAASSGAPPSAPTPGAGPGIESPWAAARTLPQAAAAKAVGSLSAKASIDRAEGVVGDIAYLEFELSGQGDFTRARPPEARVASGRATLGPVRSYPEYDPRSGRGKLTFRFPLRLAEAGTVGIRVEAYPVFDAAEGRLIPGTARSLSIKAVAAAPATGAAGEPRPARSGEKSFPAWIVLSIICAALGLSSGAFSALVADGSGQARSRFARRLSLGLCIAFLLSSAAAAMAGAGGSSGPAYDLVLGPKARLYGVPSAMARSWTQEGARARLTGKRVSADGETWYRIVLDDSSYGWMSAKDVEGARAAP